MAWTAKITNITPQQGSVVLTVEYYDSTDSTFSNLLGTQSFTFPGDTTLSAARTQVVAAGKEYRTAYNQIATLQNVTINIP
jgi:hypothetical protein